MNLPKRLIVAMLAFTAAAAADEALPTVMFTLDPPNGYLAGAAGTSVGWGYTISVNFGSPTYVFIDDFTFGDSTPVGDFSSYDSGYQFDVPSNPITDVSPITEPWLLGASGLQYDINPGAVLGAATEGVMTLTYDVYADAAQNDPIEYGLSVNAQFDPQDVDAEVFVSAPAATAPEPGAVTLFVLGALGLLLRKRSLRCPVPRQ
jgi:opacity protein-like surface antigen